MSPVLHLTTRLDGLVPVALWITAFGLACLDWYAVWRLNRRLEAFAKPAAVIAIGIAGVASGLLNERGGWLIVMGLALGLIGDVLLLDASEPRFIGGLAAFLIGHVLYLVAFLRHAPTANSLLILAIGVLLLALIASRRVIPAAARDGGAVLGVAVTAYMLILALFAVTAALTGNPWVAIGAALFLISDTVLAVDRFDRPIRRSPVLVMVTYLVAQVLIVGGWAIS